jgi:hypothetical protein
MFLSFKIIGQVGTGGILWLTVVYLALQSLGRTSNSMADEAERHFLTP